MRALALAMLILGPWGCSDPDTEAVRAADRLYRSQHWEEAATAYAELPDGAGDWRGYGAWRAGVIYRDPLGDRPRAKEQFSACAREFSDEDWGYSCLVELGDLARDGGDPRASIDAYRRAIELRPMGQWSEHCLMESGKAYGALGQHEQSRGDWSELLSRFGRSARVPEVELEIARSWDLEGNPKQARRAYQTVHRKYPKHSIAPLAMFGEAEALEQLGELDKALTLYVRVRAAHPNPRAVDLKIESIRDRQERRDVDHGASEVPDSGRKYRR